MKIIARQFASVEKAPCNFGAQPVKQSVILVLKRAEVCHLSMFCSTACRENKKKRESMISNGNMIIVRSIKILPNEKN